MIETFTYEALPIRVRFGRGTIAEAGAEVARLGAGRALVLTTPQQAAEGERLRALLGPAFSGLFPGATMHTPVEVTEAALSALKDAGADCIVALGGGSTTGLGKALALRTGLPQLVIPTTYAGSEMTPILGETREGRKTTIRSLDVLPEAVIYDVDLTVGLPPALSATSGVNAIAHAVEALYARDRNPVISLMAEDGIRTLSSALPILIHEPANMEARTKALYGAWLCGCCLGAVGMALHHKLCHTLGGTFNLPHAETHTIVLPHAVAYNAPAAPEAMAAITRALGAPDAAQGLFDLVRALRVPRALSEIGMPASGIEAAADIAVENPYWNPRPVTRDGIRDLIARAYAGERPSAASRAEEAA
ncbi:maleylacetate reductase [Xanthobacter dioxanivorans]|uniref:Maleylacetate reductase n=1 Tax=Xanthobacter dioxanivorans TaxID=2528964 RepID=A0A974PNR9_9HYPH|nr:maleylacetate reductase [Xanthobacter dioxanivorans]QRG06633.1 maleylacetate reductase [Xanthobacter dioxanivorans]